MTSAATIDALTDLQAIRVLALVVDHHAPLPDPTRLRELDTVLAHAADDPDLRPYHRSGTPPPSHGDLARATLIHAAVAGGCRKDAVNLGCPAAPQRGLDSSRWCGEHQAPTSGRCPGVGVPPLDDDHRRVKAVLTRLQP